MSIQALAFVPGSWYCSVMAKHIVPPATAEQIMRTLGVTQEDIEIVDRVLKELEEEKAWELPLDKRDAPPLPQK
jgi:hypothetical protein